MTNREKFAEAYERNLAKAVAKYPDQYVWDASRVPEVAKKMLAAVERRTYNKDGFAFKWTCQELGIKYTYAAINAYWKG